MKDAGFAWASLSGEETVTPRHKWVFGALLSLLVLGGIEALSFGSGLVLASRGVFYVPDSMDDYVEYLGKRDPELGWPNPDYGRDPNRDGAGSRIVPAYPDPTSRSCVSLYGDSFTWGSEVSDDATWGNVLALALGCRVANYGVPAYGTDQALLRYRKNLADDARVVILAHQTENILRNVNQYRALLYATSLSGFKPRFLLDQKGDLRDVALPDVPAAEYGEFVARPEAFLRHEYFLPGGASGKGRLEFPYTWSIARAFRHFQIQSELRGVPWFAEFYQPEHASGALPLTASIIDTFEDEARSRGQIPVSVVLPNGLDFAYRVQTGGWLFQSLVDELASRDVELVNVGEAMYEAMAGRDPCDFFTNCSGHYNAAGYALVAQVLEARVPANVARYSSTSVPPGFPVSR
jgi:hypothetical protein